MDFIIEKASERKKDCPYCKAGTLHQHIVEVDTNMTDYILGLGKFKEEKKTLYDKIVRNIKEVPNFLIVDDVKEHLKEFIEYIDKECYPGFKCRSLRNKAKEIFGELI